MVKEDGQYVRIKANANKEELGLILKRVNSGELKWAYYSLENEVGNCYA